MTTFPLAASLFMLASQVLEGVAFWLDLRIAQCGNLASECLVILGGGMRQHFAQRGVSLLHSRSTALYGLDCGPQCLFLYAERSKSLLGCLSTSRLGRGQETQEKDGNKKP